MKNLIFTACCLWMLPAAAQNTITIVEDTFAMSKGVQTGFKVEIPKAKLADVEQHWLKYISKGSKGKATLTAGEHFQPAAINKNISPFPFNIYSNFLATTEAVRLTAWFTENDTVFISKQLNTDRDLAAIKYLNDFAATEYQLAVKAEVKTEQDKLKLLQKDLSALIKEQEKADKKISANNRAIQKSKGNIADHNTGIEDANNKISSQKEMVQMTASDPNAHKGAQKTLRDIENSKKKLQSQIETENKNIDALNSGIREQERVVASFKEKINLKTAEIEQQKQKIADIKSPAGSKQ